jgi:hypothetical protein
MNTPNNFQGGKIQQFLQNWMKITSDPWIIKQIQGYKLEFSGVPQQSHVPRHVPFSREEKLHIDQEIDRFLNMGIIEKASDPMHGYISNIFTRPKKSGGYRIILNLKPLNNDIEHIHFKMDTLKSAINLMRKDCYFASIDLKDAYYSVAVHPSDRKYLQFYWGDQCFQFTSLPMGLSSAPRVFTKIMKPVFSHLRKLGHSIVAYIDDCLLQGDSCDACIKNVNNTVKILDNLGLTIHPTKSVFQPSKQIVYLGFILDSEKMTVSLTPEKANDIIDLCKNFEKT